MNMKELIQIFKALSDETRLRILNLLLERECCVCEVMQALEISQTRASRNLSILEGAGLVRSRRDGLWVVHYLNEEMKEYALELVELVKKALQDEELLARDRERLKKARRVGPDAMRDQLKGGKECR